jgi:hypothetical protein
MKSNFYVATYIYLATAATAAYFITQMQIPVLLKSFLVLALVVAGSHIYTNHIQRRL